jgi:DNA modification methylase
MMAAHNLKRKWIGIDISPRAASVNKQRLEVAKAKVEVIDEKDLEAEVAKLNHNEVGKVA